jgi:hypothetical protein
LSISPLMTIIVVPLFSAIVTLLIEFYRLSDFIRMQFLCHYPVCEFLVLGHLLH